MTEPNTEPQSFAETYQLAFPNSPNVALELVDVALHDALDDLFVVDLAVHSRSFELSPRDFVGHPAKLSFPSLTGGAKLSGIVASMKQEWAEPTGVSRYVMRVVPALWLTTQRTNCRIFQNESPTSLVHLIVSDYAPHIPKCRESLRVPSATRDYIAQYGETDWAFLRRKLADAGVSLGAIHDGHGAVRLCDDWRALGERIPSALPFRPDASLGGTSPHALEAPRVLEATFETQLTPSAAYERDYDYRRPRLPLNGRALDGDALEAEAALERFEFAVGQFEDADAGSLLANVRLEEARRDGEGATFKTSVPAAPGTLFKLTEHPRADANIEWLVVRSETRAQHLTATHRVWVIPAATRYRPAREAAPRIIGSQTAVVVGPSTEEIDVDSDARVCLRFHWDRRTKEANTTRRVRVSQGWAGPGYGFVCIPRIGDEVIVDFLDGDPDQPLIVGRVHNGANLTPQKLPEQKAWSTWRSRSTPGGAGFNEITFDDAAGAERFYVHAQRDAIVEVENDVHARVKGNVNGLVHGNGAGGIRGTGNLSIAGDASLKVGGDLAIDVAGSINATAGSNISLAAGNQRVDESTNHFIRTGGLYVKAQSVAQFNTANFHVFAGDIKLRAGGSEIHISSGGISIKSDGDVVVNGAVIKLN